MTELNRPEPEELLETLVARVERLAPPVAAPPGGEWFMALGALFAMGTLGLLSDGQIRTYEARMQDEARRLGAEPPMPPGVGTPGE